MPVSSQGDIFDAALRVQLAIVFGHVGFNEMRQCWDAFAENEPGIPKVQDPFAKLADHAIEWSKGKWLWFVAEQEDHGMTDEKLTSVLDAALSWASTNGIVTIATNGIANTDHGMITAQNRHSDEQRAAFLQAYAHEAEQKYGVSVELISLNDVFVRGR
jgi:hypothetical protein